MFLSPARHSRASQEKARGGGNPLKWCELEENYVDPATKLGRGGGSNQRNNNQEMYDIFHHG